MTAHRAHLAIELDAVIGEARTRMRRRRVLFVFVLAALATLATALTLASHPGGPHGSPSGGGPAPSGNGTTQAEARVTADNLLRNMILPPGAKRVSAQMAAA